MITTTTRAYASLTNSVLTSSTTTPIQHFSILVCGGGTAGVTVSSQLMAAFKGEKRPLAKNSIAILDPASLHHYQPGWTFVGSGESSLASMNKPMASVIPNGVKYHPKGVSTFSPDKNQVTLTDNTIISYDYLVVAPGLKLDWDKIPGLKTSLKASSSGVSSIYSFESVEKTWKDLNAFEKGTAIFTHPVGAVKCAGASQKILWMANSLWNKKGIRSNITPIFASGLGTMFGVPKYSAALEKLRIARNIEGMFNHNLIKVDGEKKVATFSKVGGDGSEVEVKYDLLHVVPPQAPLDFIKNSPIADAAGWVSVDPSTTQHTKYPNIFSLGDASSLPNSKTAAAISVQSPVLVDNLRALMDGKKMVASYDGYASCPILTGHNELMLCEFKYGGVPKETFAFLLGSQDKPNAFYYFITKHIFPRLYWVSFLKGTWFGPRTFFRPISYMKE